VVLFEYDIRVLLCDTGDLGNLQIVSCRRHHHLTLVRAMAGDQLEKEVSVGGLTDVTGDKAKHFKLLVGDL
jgi:hypothetical protein